MTDFRKDRTDVSTILSETADMLRANFIVITSFAIIGSLLGLFITTLEDRTGGIGAILAILISFLIVPVIQAGFALEIYDAKKESRRVSIGNSFKHLNKDMIILVIKRNLRVIGWLLLFVIPGLYFSMAYDRAIYLKHDNPHLTDKECFDKSKREMDGYKLTLFISSLAVIIPTMLIAVPVFTSILTKEPARSIIDEMKSERLAGATNYLTNPMSNIDYINVMFKVSPIIAIITSILLIVVSAFTLSISPVFHVLRDEDKGYYNHF